MPASGFLISCASTAAMPCIERTAPRAINWRSMRWARLRSCNRRIRAFGFGRDRQRHIGKTLAEPGGGQVDIAFGDRSAALARLLDELKKRTPKGNQIGELLLQQEAQAHSEELLGGLVGVEQLVLRPDHDQRHRQAARDCSAYEPIRLGKRDTVPSPIYLCFTVTPTKPIVPT